MALVLVLAPTTAPAQEADSAATAQSIDHILNPDGTLILDRPFNGTVDPAKWRMEIEKDGTPRFVAMAPMADDSTIDSSGRIAGDQYWDNRFGHPGPTGAIYAILVDGTDVYVGGRFINVAGIRGNSIARWSTATRRWSTLGGGVTGTVRALALIGDDLYVGGVMRTAGPLAVNGIARWHIPSKEWYELGSGVVRVIDTGIPPKFLRYTRPGDVFAMAVHDSSLYVGGQFYVVDNPAIQNLARWDGTGWKSIGATPDSVVFALGFAGDTMYVGGAFDRVAAGHFKYLATYSLATGAWGSIGDANDTVWALAVNGGRVYVGGRFTSIGGKAIRGVAYHSGSGWNALAGGVDGTVLSLASDGADVYVGGLFASAGGRPANCIAKWNGGSWSALGIGMGLSASGMTEWAPPNIGDSNSGRPIVFDFQDGPSTVPFVWALGAHDGNVFAGGHFTSAGSVTIHHVAAWSSDAWHPLAGDSVELTNHNGVDGPIYTLAYNGTDLYVGGDFSRAGTVPAHRVARYAGGKWLAIGPALKNGVNGFVHSIAGAPESFIAAGEFSHASDLYTRFVMRVDDGSASSLGSDSRDGLYAAIGITRSASIIPVVTAVVARDTDVYICGRFVAAGGVPVNGVARWNGSEWSAVLPPGKSFDGTVRALAFDSRGDLYVGGEFTKLGDLRVNGIVRFNGRDWSPLGTGMAGAKPYVYTLTASGDDIVAGGAFASAGGTRAAKVARWSPAAGTWSAMGIFLDSAQSSGYVQALAAFGSQVYAAAISTFGSSIFMWNGSAWLSLTDRIDNKVMALTVDKHGDLYAGGDFMLYRGSTQVRLLARWDGTTWNNFGPGLRHTILALAISNSDLYIGGTFPWAAASNTAALARWNGTDWLDMGRGMGFAFYPEPFPTPSAGVVYGIAAVGSDVYAGGNFSLAGATPSYGFGHWSRPTPHTTSVPATQFDARPGAQAEARWYPNPFNGATTLHYNLQAGDDITIDIYDLRGELVDHLFAGYVPAGAHGVQWEPRNVAAGAYMCQVHGNLVDLSRGIFYFGDR